MHISVIVPAYQSASSLARCLDALAASTLRPLETIVVDDGSTDGTGAVAEAAGAVVIRVPDGPRGPATARNIAAAVAQGDILVFVDADVVVLPLTLQQFAEYLRRHPQIVAVFGSYDDEPDAPSLVSQYRNLLHHFVHQTGAGEASTFWAGCGAIRREVFEAVGGFDQRYARPSIEDIELGVRMREAGHRIRLCPEIQATHLKHWSLWSTLQVDILDKAVPWSRLIAGTGEIPDDLNTAVRSRISAAAAWMATLALLTMPVGTPWWVGLVAVGIILLFNAPLYRLFVRKGGLSLGIAGICLHFLYFLYSSAIFVVVRCASVLHRGSPTARGLSDRLSHGRQAGAASPARSALRIATDTDPTVLRSQAGGE